MLPLWRRCVAFCACGISYKNACIDARTRMHISKLFNAHVQKRSFHRMHGQTNKQNVRQYKQTVIEPNQIIARKSVVDVCILLIPNHVYICSHFIVQLNIGAVSSSWTSNIIEQLSDTELLFSYDLQLCRPPPSCSWCPEPHTAHIEIAPQLSTTASVTSCCGCHRSVVGWWNH